LVAIVTWTTLPLPQQQLLVILLASIPFPVLLLSMMENSSPLGFFSHPILSSFREIPGAWFKFYLLGTVLVLLCEACLFQLTRMAGEAWTPLMTTIMVLIVFCLTVLTTIYFRLLGRLGWLLTQQIMIDVETDDPGSAYRDELHVDDNSKFSIGV
jgi:hypothetical protein